MIYIFQMTMLIFLSAFNLVVIRAIIIDDAYSRKRIIMMSIMLVFIIFSFLLFAFAYMSKHAAELIPI